MTKTLTTKTERPNILHILINFSYNWQLQQQNMLIEASNQNYYFKTTNKNRIQQDGTAMRGYVLVIHSTFLLNDNHLWLI